MEFILGYDGYEQYVISAEELYYDAELGEFCGIECEEPAGEVLSHEVAEAALGHLALEELEEGAIIRVEVDEDGEHYPEEVEYLLEEGEGYCDEMECWDSELEGDEWEEDEEEYEEE